MSITEGDGRWRLRLTVRDWRLALEAIDIQLLSGVLSREERERFRALAGKIRLAIVEAEGATSGTDDEEAD